MADPATPPKTAAYPQLNLQPTMSCSSLCLETPPFNRNHIDRLIICSLRRSPSQTICSDSYKTETKRPLHSLFPFEFEEADPTVLHSPVKAARKVVRSPYKVLDAPALQDDFYLNLVDWSSHNVLAVDLGCISLQLGKDNGRTPIESRVFGLEFICIVYWKP
ncbi:hypothetical protein CDL15_Pgr016462 [Punica granatum]|uniref:Uncharacterized protein n=1 Tax=Punica granatum TaxID=22663 RepID=A0A218XSY0_PUNGR|nr:hypothetical protein CDL15_Pgr016462 [Punica granatum]